MKAKTFQRELERLNRIEVDQVAMGLYQRLPQETRQTLTCSMLLRKEAPDRSQSIDSGAMLLREIQYFITQVREQYYYYPNAVIPQADREHWQSLVQEWLYWLTQKAPFALDALTKAQALEALYRVFCRASDVPYFHVDDVFVSLQYSQTEFYQLVLQHWDGVGDTTILLQKGLDLLLYNSLNWSTLYTDLMDVYLQVLGEARWQQALTHAQQVLRQRGLDVARQAENRSDEWFRSKAEGQRIVVHNNLVELIFRLYAHTGEVGRGAQFFQQQYCAPTEEAKLYVLIGLLMLFKQETLIQDYLAQAIAASIPLRSSLNALLDQSGIST